MTDDPNNSIVFHDINMVQYTLTLAFQLTVNPDVNTPNKLILQTISNYDADLSKYATTDSLTSVADSVNAINSNLSSYATNASLNSYATTASVAASINSTASNANSYATSYANSTASSYANSTGSQTFINAVATAHTYTDNRHDDILNNQLIPYYATKSYVDGQTLSKTSATITKGDNFDNYVNKFVNIDIYGLNPITDLGGGGGLPNRTLYGQFISMPGRNATVQIIFDNVGNMWNRTCGNFWYKTGPDPTVSTLLPVHEANGYWVGSPISVLADLDIANMTIDLGGTLTIPSGDGAADVAINVDRVYKFANGRNVTFNFNNWIGVSNSSISVMVYNNHTWCILHNANVNATFQNGLSINFN